MQRLLERCAGLDVHKQTVTACIRVPGDRGSQHQEVRTFGTTTEALLTLRDWLTAHQVTHVAMESTGVYWKPVYYLLEDHFTCVLVNAAHVRHVPGRKSDVQDCVWLAQLLEHGLIRGSFVPPAPLRDLRDLTRYRKTAIQERARVANRLHKVLEDAGIKLASVASDVLGVSGRAMLHALVAGTTDPTHPGRTSAWAAAPQAAGLDARPSPATSGRTMPFWWAGCWRTWSTATKRLRISARASTS